jgi:hypothetical protein
VVEAALVTCANDRLSLTLSLARVVSKLVPVMVTDVPAVPMVGVKPVIVGGPLAAVTVKLPLLVAEPAGAVTEMGPVVAVAGTVRTSSVAVADVTSAVTPLTRTVFCADLGDVGAFVAFGEPPDLLVPSKSVPDTIRRGKLRRPCQRKGAGRLQVVRRCQLDEDTRELALQPWVSA